LTVSECFGFKNTWIWPWLFKTFDSIRLSSLQSTIIQCQSTFCIKFRSQVKQVNHLHGSNSQKQWNTKLISIAHFSSSKCMPIYITRIMCSNITQYKTKTKTKTCMLYTIVTWSTYEFWHGKNINCRFLYLCLAEKHPRTCSDFTLYTFTRFIVCHHGLLQLILGLISQKLRYEILEFEKDLTQSHKIGL
jgi:hypothetical protein